MSYQIGMNPTEVRGRLGTVVMARAAVGPTWGSTAAYAVTVAERTATGVTVDVGPTWGSTAERAVTVTDTGAVGTASAGLMCV
jgi:hypothetical protein